MSGELYDVDDEMLANLDDLENHPHLYRRTIVQCVIEQTATASTNDSETTSSIVDSEVYMIHDYNPTLMSLPFLSSYDDDAIKDGLYSSREERVEDYDLFGVVKAQ